MSKINTNGEAKERFVYIVLTILFLIASIFCFINGVEFVNLRKNDPDGELEINTSYTIFLIVMNFFFALVTLFFVFAFCLKAINPRGQGWADKIINKFKIARRKDEDKFDKIKQEYKDKYVPQVTTLIDNTIAIREASEKPDPCGSSIRGPKIIYTKPQDTQTAIPNLNEPVKRFSLGDFLPYSVTKQQRAQEALNSPKPITLESLKDLYLSKKQF
jgi:hypothetical protein